MSLAPVLILLLGIAIGIPVAFAIGMAGLSFFLISGAMPPEIFIQRIVAVTHSFPLLAVPLFVMTGVVMNYAGITSRMMSFAEAMTGHWKGGLAQVNVLLSTLLGGVSGSANADAAMQSKVLVPEMTKRGYDPAFSTAVTASSSIISVIIPPGIGLILYGFMGDVSIGRLFLAGIVPGVLICAAMMGAVALRARQLDLQPAYEAPLPWVGRGRAFRGAFLALLVPVLAVSVVAVFAALFLSCALVYQGVRSFCERSDNDVVVMSATYTVMSASLLAWGVLMAMVWAF